MSLLRSTAAAVLCFSLAAIAHAHNPRSDPNNKGGWVLYEPMSDEFDRPQLDAAKWRTGMPYRGWHGRKPAWHNDPAAVEVKDGELILKGYEGGDDVDYPAGFDVSAGYVTSRRHRRYGYFEMEAKAFDADLVTCFWMYADCPAWAREIDQLEVPAGSAGWEHYYHANLHTWHHPTPEGVVYEHFNDSEKFTLDFRPTEGYHIYALEWDKQFCRFYIDGALMRKTPTVDFRMGNMIFAGLEWNPWFLKSLDRTRLPATYNIRYIRTWIKPPTNRTYYVDAATGDDSRSGLSWDKAKQTIRAAIDEAYDGDEIWVAAGTYQEYVVLYGIHGMKIYGGFERGADSLSQRDAAKNPTSIQAPIDGHNAVDIRDVTDILLSGFIVDGVTEWVAGRRYNNPSTSNVLTNCRNRRESR